MKLAVTLIVDVYPTDEDGKQIDDESELHGSEFDIADAIAGSLDPVDDDEFPECLAGTCIFAKFKSVCLKEYSVVKEDGNAHA